VIQPNLDDNFISDGENAMWIEKGAHSEARAPVPNNTHGLQLSHRNSNNGDGHVDRGLNIPLFPSLPNQRIL
jgi:hypothetical protein